MKNLYEVIFNNGEGFFVFGNSKEEVKDTVSKLRFSDFRSIEEIRLRPYGSMHEGGE